MEKGSKFIEYLKKTYPELENKDLKVGQKINCLNPKHQDKEASMIINENNCFCFGKGCNFKISMNGESFTTLVDMCFDTFVQLSKKEIPTDWGERRGYKPEVLKELGIGLITKEVYTELNKRFGSDIQKEVGLIDTKGRGLWYNRVIVHSTNGYFSGRSQEPNPKVKNKFPKGIKKKLMIFAGEETPIICEGETTAIALKHIFPKHKVVAIGGVGSWNLVSQLEDLYDVILCFDNDTAGEDCENKVYSYFHKKGIKVSKIKFSKEFNDFDDLHFKYRDNTTKYFTIGEIDEVTDLLIPEGKHIDFLRDKNILNLICNEIELKAVGELNAKKTILLVAFMSKVKNINYASSNLYVSDEGGTGKDFVISKTLELLPFKWWIRRTRISPTALTYWKPVENWNGYILYLEDISNSLFNCDVLKVMASGGSYATIVIKQEAVDIEIKGKPTIIVTSATAKPTPETARRFPIASLNSSQEQTSKVVSNKLSNAEVGEPSEYNKDITRALELLKRIKVKIPFATKLIDIFPTDHIIMRTQIDRFIDFIKSSCALHQYQRKFENGYYLAIAQDYNIARDIFNSMSSTDKGIPITKEQRKLLDTIKALQKEKVEKFEKRIREVDNEGNPKQANQEDIEQECWVSVNEILTMTTSTDPTIRGELKKFVEWGLLEVKAFKTTLAKQKVAHYNFKPISNIHFPSFEELAETNPELKQYIETIELSNV